MRRRLPGARYMRAGKGRVADERSSRTKHNENAIDTAAFPIRLLFSHMLAASPW